MAKSKFAGADAKKLEGTVRRRIKEMPVANAQNLRARKFVKRRAPPPRRHGAKTVLPVAEQPEYQPKRKISIAVDAADLEWATKHAEVKHASLSAVFGEALEMLKRRYDLTALLEHLGGTDDIDEHTKAAVDAELREAGVIQ